MSEPTQTQPGVQELPPQMVLVQMWVGYLLSRALHVAAGKAEQGQALII